MHRRIKRKLVRSKGLRYLDSLQPYLIQYSVNTLWAWHLLGNVKDRKSGSGTSLAVQWLRRLTSTAGVAGLIPRGGTQILHAVTCGQNVKKQWGDLWWGTMSVANQHIAAYIEVTVRDLERILNSSLSHFHILSVTKTF